MGDAIQSRELYSGIGPTAGELGPGASIAHDASEWNALLAQAPVNHPLRRAPSPDWSASAVLFVRVLADSGARAQARSVTRDGGLTVRVGLRWPEPQTLAAVPAMAWLVLAVPRAAVAGRPTARVEVVR